MSENKKPVERAAETVKKGFGELFRAAGGAAKTIREEIDKGGIGKTFEDSGREVLRAASNVANVVGEELLSWGKKAQESLDGVTSSEDLASASGSGDWPRTRDEYEKKYGKAGDEWPRSRDAYIRRYGYAPEDKPTGPTEKDPGFRIATPPDDDGA